MQEWIVSLWAVCAGDQIVQYSFCAAAISGAVNLFAGRLSGVELSVAQARVAAGKDAGPLPNVLWVMVSNVVFIVSAIAMMAAILRHMIFR